MYYSKGFTEEQQEELRKNLPLQPGTRWLIAVAALYGASYALYYVVMSAVGAFARTANSPDIQLGLVVASIGPLIIVCKGLIMVNTNVTILSRWWQNNIIGRRVWLYNDADSGIRINIDSRRDTYVDPHFGCAVDLGGWLPKAYPMHSAKDLGGGFSLKRPRSMGYWITSRQPMVQVADKSGNTVTIPLHLFLTLTNLDDPYNQYKFTYDWGAIIEKLYRNEREKDLACTVIAETTKIIQDKDSHRIRQSPRIRKIQEISQTVLGKIRHWRMVALDQS